jgi:hypothetical protein
LIEKRRQFFSFAKCLQYLSGVDEQLASLIGTTEEFLAGVISSAVSNSGTLQ